MGVMLDIPEELATLLKREASRLGVSLSDYIVQRLGVVPRPSAVSSGAELVDYWKQRGLIGTRPDIEDSPAHARVLREKAQRRD